jgi:hypothetical protein
MPWKRRLKVLNVLNQINDFHMPLDQQQIVQIDFLGKHWQLINQSGY